MADLFKNLSGSINAQNTITNEMISDEYTLTYTCNSIGNGNSFLVIKGLSTYFFPMQFVGKQEMRFKANLNGVVTCVLHGNASISDLTLSTYSNITEADRNAIELVKNESDYWARIKEITNNIGKVRAEMLEGLINLTANAFANETGTITQENGIMTFLNGSSPATSTQAVQITGGAIRIANNKDANGNWIWTTAISGAGINAQTIIADTLATVDFSAANIQAANVTLAHLKGCDIKGGEMWVGSSMPESEATMGNYTGMRVLSDGRIKGYYQGTESFTLAHSHSGQLTLKDPINQNSLILSGSKTEEATLYTTDRNIVIMKGTPQSVNGRLVNPRIELTDGAIDLYAFRDSGTQVGTVTIAGDLVVRGNITAYSVTTENGSL